MRLLRSSLLPLSCSPPLPLSTLPPRVVSLALREAVAFSQLVPRRLLHCEPLRSSSCSSSLSCRGLAGVHSFCGTDVLKMFHFCIDGLCALANVYWCVEGVLAIYRSCGSCICLVASCSSSCASVGVLSFFQVGDSCFSDGVLACVVVAQCLVGVFNILYGCCSCKVSGSLRVLVISLFLRVFSSSQASLRISFLEVCGSRALQANPKQQKDTDSQASGYVTADCDDVLVQGAGEQGAVSCLLAGMEQASGRVDVPDGAKIEAAAASPGTSRFRPGNADALGMDQSSGPKIQFSQRELEGIRGWYGDGSRSIHDAVGHVHGEICVTLGAGNWTFKGLYAAVAFAATIHCLYVAGSVCATGVARRGLTHLLVHLGMARTRERNKGPLGRNPPVTPSNVPARKNQGLCLQKARLVLRWDRLLPLKKELRQTKT